MHEDFKDAKSMHSGPVNQRYVFSKMIEEDCWAAPKLCRLIYGIRILHRGTFLKVHLRILRHPIQGYPHHGTIQIQVEFPREPARSSLYLKMVMEEKRRNTYSEISTKFFSWKMSMKSRGRYDMNIKIPLTIS